MRRSALLLLLALGGTANAALPRVSIETPLLPVSAPAFSASPALLSASPAPLGFAAAPALSAAPSAMSAPLQAPAIFAAPAAASASLEPAGPNAIDELHANAALADQITASAETASLENSAEALEHDFDAAAPKNAEGDDGGARAPLFERLLQNVRLDDGGVPERRAALRYAFERMLETPTARALAERFIADGVPAVVRFETFEGSRIFEVDGRKIFYAPRAFTEWKGDHVEVRLNLDYLGTSRQFLQQDLPPTIAHELLGHGLWYSRASKENAMLAFHHHELNEANARLVGWLVDFELDRRFEEGAPWSYMQDPAAFMSYLKLRLPYYALTWSTAELARPRETLEERSLAARAKRDQLRLNLANHSSWNGVIDFFVSHRAVDEAGVRALRAYMAETSKSYEDEILRMDSLITEVDAMVGRMSAEPDQQSEKYLQWAATHPLFADLRREADESARRLIEQVARANAKPADESPSAKRAREDHWRGQLTFQELMAMYQRDREEHPEHWQR